jgi:hypothetical protein
MALERWIIMNREATLSSRQRQRLGQRLDSVCDHPTYRLLSYCYCFPVITYGPISKSCSIGQLEYADYRFNHKWKRRA